MRPEEQLSNFVNIYSNRSTLPDFPRVNSYSTDITKRNDFRRVVVIVNSQKLAKTRV